MIQTKQVKKVITQPAVTLNDRVNQLKGKAGFIEYRRISVQEASVVEKSDFAKRIIRGYLCKWGYKNDYGEKIIKGACAKSIADRGPDSQAKYKITFHWMHDPTDPLAVFAVLKEDDYGLYFETLPLDNVDNADRAIEQIRSGTLNQFSIGFYYIWDKIEYDEADDCLVLLEIDLVEGSVVTRGADDMTYALRSKDYDTTMSELHDTIEDFINTLPRKDRFQARQLFTQQKALVEVEKRKAKLKPDKPPMKKVKKRGINLNYLTENL